ncbi:MAG: UDP-4-amino-4,6-dideoxy-N-acetyl-beta-L-altrosamine transaminase [Treponema sp. RIFOXYC1_FULL_61_9]|nr:MAG: UDP-4-amino-4,6-dideoxy-N-acetyl-beta-L-altrosamine transaminase [Treponema sp. RIFOXYC1_FULL_61_9]
MSAPTDRTESSAQAIPFAYPFMGSEEEEAAIRVLRSGWLTTGREALEFEKEFAAALDPSGESGLRALAVNSATSGLHLALEACGVGPGDVVLTSPYTFTSTAEVIRYLGADVAFVDVGPGSYLIDPDALDRTAARLAEGLSAYADGRGPTGRPVAVMPVHFAGLPCDMDAIARVAARHGLRVVEDAAHSFPSRFPDGRCAGALGDVGVFSFYATKTITTGEGGMVVTADPELAARISVMRSHGIDRSIWNRYTDRKASWRYAVIEAGFKYNLPDLLAAVGRAQLAKAGRMLEMRRSIAARYDQAFSSDPRFRTPPTGFADARHLYPLRLAAGMDAAGTDAAGTDAAGRNRMIDALQEAGIGTSVHFIPLHTMPYYAGRYKLRDGDFPNAMESFSASLSLPIWPGMSDGQVDRVIAAVRAAAVRAACREAAPSGRTPV